MFGAKVQIAAIENGLDFELVMVPFETAYEPKHPEVARVNPKRPVPVVIHGDMAIFDYTPIIESFERLEMYDQLVRCGCADTGRPATIDTHEEGTHVPQVTI